GPPRQREPRGLAGQPEGDGNTARGGRGGHRERLVAALGGVRACRDLDHQWSRHSRTLVPPPGPVAAQGLRTSRRGPVARSRLLGSGCGVRLLGHGTRSSWQARRFRCPQAGVRVASGAMTGMVNAGILVLALGLMAVAAILLVIRLGRLK